MEKNILRKLSKYATIFLIGLSIPFVVQAEENENAQEKVVNFHSESMVELTEKKLPDTVARFVYDSGLDFEYPEAVRGIYLTGNSAGGSRLPQYIDMIKNSDLNSMVIDVKEDNGMLTFRPDEDSPYYERSRNLMSNPREILEKLEEEQIYPIARIVVFKDTQLAQDKPEWSFLDSSGKVWKNNKGESFVNPFVKDVWEYNVGVAKMAAELGFQDIQFDYVRFPEGFERRDKELRYSEGDYVDYEGDNVQKRVQAVTDFVEYAREALKGYDVDVSVDIFGYSATIPEAPGIGQNFTKISENVDVISSMIYPSHWTSYFGIAKPDTEPYKLVQEYVKVENERLGELENPPTSRPWIQDFEAPWLYPSGVPVFQYGKKEVEDQIRALNEAGIKEFLIWNANNRYTEGVDYTPLN
ncbi:putative glycoside hydrolase [Bacillaceae bacterium S4-13-58]